MSYSLTKFLAHYLFEKNHSLPICKCISQLGHGFLAGFFPFLLLLTGREVEGWQGANYKTLFWSTSGTEEMIIAAFGCGLNYATSCGSLSDHTTPANCTFLPLFCFYSDNPIFSSILIWKVIAWMAERVEDKIRIWDFYFTGRNFCVFPVLLIKPWKFWVISTISTTGCFTVFFSKSIQ